MSLASGKEKITNSTAVQNKFAGVAFNIVGRCNILIQQVKLLNNITSTLTVTCGL